MTADILTLPRDKAALDLACAMIVKAFDTSAEIAMFKRRVADFIQLGTGHYAVRARYGRRAKMLRGYSLPGAIYITEQWYRQEQRDCRWAHLYGIPHTRLSLQVLRELRLILRYLRRSKDRNHFAGYIGFIDSGHPLLLDAEAETDTHHTTRSQIT
jgi:hypothetical protein